jgi:hypothetical protein
MHGMDYQKASDSVPHRWIIKFLESIGINYKTASLTKKDRRHWKTSMRLHTEGKITETEDLEIRWNIARRFIVTTTLALALSPHRAVLKAEFRI